MWFSFSCLNIEGRIIESLNAITLSLTLSMVIGSLGAEIDAL
jgi:hypothetical protein